MLGKEVCVSSLSLRWGSSDPRAWNHDVFLQAWNSRSASSAHAGDACHRVTACFSTLAVWHLLRLLPKRLLSVPVASFLVCSLTVASGSCARILSRVPIKGCGETPVIARLLALRWQLPLESFRFRLDKSPLNLVIGLAEVLSYDACPEQTLHPRLQLLPAALVSLPSTECRQSSRIGVRGQRAPSETFRAAIQIQAGWLGIPACTRGALSLESRILACSSLSLADRLSICKQCCPLNAGCLWTIRKSQPS